MIVKLPNGGWLNTSAVRVAVPFDENTVVVWFIGGEQAQNYSGEARNVIVAALNAEAERNQ